MRERQQKRKYARAKRVERESRTRIIQTRAMLMGAVWVEDMQAMYKQSYDENSGVITNEYFNELGEPVTKFDMVMRKFKNERYMK